MKTHVLNNGKFWDDLVFNCGQLLAKRSIVTKMDLMVQKQRLMPMDFGVINQSQWNG